MGGKEGEGEKKQVIVVVTEGWIVMCFDHDLNLLWENSPVDEVPEDYYHEEVFFFIIITIIINDLFIIVSLYYKMK